MSDANFEDLERMWDPPDPAVEAVEGLMRVYIDHEEAKKTLLPYELAGATLLSFGSSVLTSVHMEVVPPKVVEPETAFVAGVTSAVMGGALLGAWGVARAVNWVTFRRRRSRWHKSDI